jgi:thioredoxin reductase (NADPH)
VIHRRDRLRAAQVIQERALQNDRISFILDSVVTEIRGGGDQGVDRLTLREAKGTQFKELSVNGVFVFVGIQPTSGFVPAAVDRDKFGFIRTDQEMQTSVPGVFAAGDVRMKALRQIVTAVGDGATAAFNAGRYVEDHF